MSIYLKGPLSWWQFEIFEGRYLPCIKKKSDLNWYICSAGVKTETRHSLWLRMLSPKASHHGIIINSVLMTNVALFPFRSLGSIASNFLTFGSSWILCRYLLLDSKAKAVIYPISFSDSLFTARSNQPVMELDTSSASFLSTYCAFAYSVLYTPPTLFHSFALILFQTDSINCWDSHSCFQKRSLALSLSSVFLSSFHWELFSSRKDLIELFPSCKPLITCGHTKVSLAQR